MGYPRIRVEHAPPAEAQHGPVHLGTVWWHSRAAYGVVVSALRRFKAVWKLMMLTSR